MKDNPSTLDTIKAIIQEQNSARSKFNDKEIADLRSEMENLRKNLEQELIKKKDLEKQLNESKDKSNNDEYEGLKSKFQSKEREIAELFEKLTEESKKSEEYEKKIKEISKKQPKYFIGDYGTGKVLADIDIDFYDNKMGLQLLETENQVKASGEGALDKVI